MPPIGRSPYRQDTKSPYKSPIQARLREIVEKAYKSTPHRSEAEISDKKPQAHANYHESPNSPELEILPKNQEKSPEKSPDRDEKDFIDREKRSLFQGEEFESRDTNIERQHTFEPQKLVEKSEERFPQIIPEEKESSERPRFMFNPEPENKERSEVDNSFQAFLAKRQQRTMQGQEESKYHQVDSDSESIARENFSHKNTGSNRYKGKKPLLDKSAGFDKPAYKPSPPKRSYGYGELPKPESPHYRESCFFDSKRFNYDAQEKSNGFHEPSEQMYRERRELEYLNEPVKKHTPVRHASDIYNMLKETSEQNRYDTYGIHNFKNSYKPSDMIEVDPADVSMVAASNTRHEPFVRQLEKEPDHISEPESIFEEPQGCQVKYCDKLVELFKRIVYTKITEGIEKFDETYLSNLKTDSHSFKASVIYDEMTMRLDKYKFRSKLAEDLLEKFQVKDIRLNALNIGCSEKLNQQKLKCLFTDNQSAVEYFIKGFKTAAFFPTSEQLQLIVDFHCANRYKLSICENSIKKFILASSNPMVERQYFAQWMKEIYGVNLCSITTASLTPPNPLEDKEDDIRVKLLALICLFYNISPIQASNLQLFSIVYLKPYFCVKSHCGKYILILPSVYSNYLSKLISDTESCEKKSCSQSIKGDLVRTFCYHTNKNTIFKK